MKIITQHVDITVLHETFYRLKIKLINKCGIMW